MNSNGKSKPMSKAELRHSAIVKILMESDRTQIKDLAEILKVSLMTIHRDLNTLQSKGLVRRVRGSVSAERSLVFESSYLFRSNQYVEEKRALAEAAVQHIEPGNAIIWDDSSTTYQICDYIESVTPVTVITNGLPVVSRLHAAPDVDLVCTGGKYHKSYNGFFGLTCEESIRTYHVDVALLSTTTVQGLSIYTADEQVVRVKRAMIDIAQKRILLADSSKFTFTALHYVADLSVFDLVLASKSTDAQYVDKMVSAGINLELV